MLQIGGKHVHTLVLAEVRNDGLYSVQCSAERGLNGVLVFDWVVTVDQLLFVVFFSPLLLPWDILVNDLV
jgi:hypothetical protein